MEVGIKCTSIWGKYTHMLSSHASLMYRLISGHAGNVEDEEREFKENKVLILVLLELYKGAD